MRKIIGVVTLGVVFGGLALAEDLPVTEGELTRVETADQVRVYYGLTSYGSALSGIDSSYMMGVELDHKYNERWSTVGAISASSAKYSVGGGYFYNETSGDFNRISLSYSGEYRFAQFENYQVYGRVGAGVGRTEITAKMIPYSGRIGREYKISGTELSGLAGIGISSNVYKNIGLGAEARFTTNVYSKMDQELIYNEADLKNELVDASTYSLLASLTYNF